MYQFMKPAILVSLLLLVGAAPATRPTTNPSDRLIVQVRHVEYAPKPDQPAIDLAKALEIPPDAKEVSSLQVLAEPGTPFDAVAVVNGDRYSFSGKLKKRARATDGKDYVGLEFDYRETTDKDPGSITQVRSNVILVPGEPLQIGGLNRDPIVVGLILTVKQPDAAPAR